MTPSDLIALGVAATSLIVSLAGFLFNYLNNQANIKARRAEIITEKSVEAYRELIEKLNMFILVKTTEKQGEKLGISAQLPYNVEDDLFVIYSKNGLYFPDSIGKDILSLANSFSRKSKFRDNNAAVLKARELIDRAQKHLGIENKE